MSTRINHNILSMTAQRAIYNAQNALDTALTRLSTGLRINNSWDDVPGLTISEKLRAQIASMEEAEKNTQNAINMFGIAEAAMSVIDEKLIRMRALAVEASIGTLTSSDRASINYEFQQLKSEVDRIARITNYNGLYLLNGAFSGSGTNGIKLHIGTHNIQNQDYYHVSLGNMTASALGILDLDLLTTVNSQSAIDSLDVAIDSKDNERTRIGSYVSRLQNTIVNLQYQQENAVATESQIRDADIATEMSNFLRSQIQFQSAIAMLSQANQVPQMVAQLIG